MSQTQEKERKPQNANANANTNSMSRRQALSKMTTAAIGAAAVVVIGGVAYYLSTSQAPPTPSPTTVAPTTVAPTTVAPTTVAPSTEIVPGGRPLKFNVWGYHPEVIQENMDIFNQQYGENGSLIQSPGDYYASLETRLMTGAASGIDMFYVHSDWMTRWYKAGWIQSVNDEEHFDEIRNDYGNKRLLDVLTQPDGKQTGWIYFNGCVPVQYDGKILQAAGLAGDDGVIKSPPKTWDEFTDILRTIKKSGAAKNPYFPKWINCTTCGIDEIFDMYCISEGELQFDKVTQEPTFENDTVMHLMELMRTWIAEDLALKGTFAMSEQDNITGFATGRYAFTEVHDYDLVNFNDPEKSPHAGWYHWLPRQPGKTGDWPYMGAIYAITSHEYMKRSANDAKRVERLHQFYSWKDKEGDYRAGRKWIQQPPFLGQPYTAFYDDPVTKANWLKQTYTEQDYEIRKKAHMTCVVPPGYVGMIFYSRWHATVMDYMPKMCLGEITPQDCMKILVDSANDLRKEYGGPEIWK